MKIGCHVSIAGGIFKAPANAVALGCEVFQIFTRSPRGGAVPELTEQIVKTFKEEKTKYNFSECQVHTPYFINFGSKNPRIYHGSVSIVRQELDRASRLGIPYVVTHLGSYKDLGVKKGFAQLIEGLEKVFAAYKGSAILLLENSAGAGDLIGGTFEELGEILNDKKFKGKLLGVCFDTCHAFTSGYDLRTKLAVNGTLKKFDELVGIKHLKTVHLNDSKFDLSAHRDRHEHIGKGKIGRLGFEEIVNHPKLAHLNGYLETEHDAVQKDIEVLKSLRK